MKFNVHAAGFSLRNKIKDIGKVIHWEITTDSVYPSKGVYILNRHQNCNTPLSKTLLDNAVKKNLLKKTEILMVCLFLKVEVGFVNF